MRPKKVLVIRYSSMGDVLLISPVIRLLHTQYNARVDLLTKKPYAALYERNPYVHRVFNHGECSIEFLRNEKYSVIVDLQKNIRSILLSWKLGVSRVTYKKEYLKTWLFLTFKYKQYPLRHVTSRYIDALKRLDLLDDGDGLDLFPNKRPPYSEDVPKGDYVVLIAGGTYITKRLPLPLISEIAHKSSIKFVVLGGKDVDQNEFLPPKNVMNLIGKTSITMASDIIRESQLVITGDTGLMHVAAALQKPIIVIWGSTDEIFGFYPYYGKKSHQSFTSIMVPNLSCRPCSKYGRQNCPLGHMKCLNSITAEEVISAINQTIS